MGADVIKIEPPWGDASRTSPQYPSIEGQNAYYMFVNRNKKSVVLDLKTDEGVKILKKLVKKSDVIIENFRPGVMDRLGIGYDDLKLISPKIVYASISGFGQDGPYVNRPSFDIIAQAMSGWMWLNSREPRGLNNQAPMVPSCLAGSPGDTVPGLFCALSILAALRGRDQTGQGQRIDIAQTDALITLSGLALTRTLYMDSTADERAKRDSERIHGVYEAKDGYIVIRIVGEKPRISVADVLGIKPKEVHPSSEAFKKWFKARTRDEITKLLAERVPCSSVLTDEELIDDPNVKARGIIVRKQHPLGFEYRTVSTGIKFSDTKISIDNLPPELGDDTVEVLKYLGYDENEVQRLLEAKIAYKS
jgi:CoA:oxalate CoA-transferase